MPLNLIRFFILVCTALPALASATSGTASVHADPIAPIIVGVSLILLFAVMGRFIAVRFKQASLLGELVMGIILGNVGYWLGIHIFIILREGPAVFPILAHTLSGHSLSDAVHKTLGQSDYATQLLAVLQSPARADLLKVAQVVDVFSRYGVIFLLFLVGLETRPRDLIEAGVDSCRVAIIGVVAPMILGFLVAYWFLPGMPLKTDLFIAATLGATSISITARVLTDMDRIRSPEAHIILGAAVFDDILGLILLAVITNLVVSDGVSVSSIFKIIAEACFFVISAIAIGPLLIPICVKALRRFPLQDVKLYVSFLFTMFLAWFASVMDLASIIGAFIAGIIMHDGYFVGWPEETQRKFTIKNLFAPLEAVLAPMFFILIGIQVKFESFQDWRVLLIAGALTVAAIVGKLVSGYGANKSTRRLVIGIGMLPRGEVGVLFASIGKSLNLLDDSLFAAIILMVTITTLITPPLLHLMYNEKGAHHV